MLDPKSIIDGGRRYSFDIDGQRSLVQNCTTRNGRHDYVNGSRTCGPNVFYNSTATLQQSDIGPHHRWSTGILFDNLTGNGNMNVQNRLVMGSGHGWSGGQIMFWNCSAARMAIQDPQGDARNWAIGCICPDITGVGDATTEPIGVIQSQGTRISAIPSLFIAQLNDRLATLSNNQYDFISNENSLLIAPNPAKSQITIHSNHLFKSKSKISIFNVNGQIVRKQIEIIDYSDDNFAFNLDVSDLKDGIYFAEVINDTISKNIKFIIKK
jgi:hypothetical protein